MSSESESAPPCLALEKCSLVLVDVAGTTTSINFVKDTLFPFVTAQVEEFLKGKWEEDAIKECVKLIKDGDDLDLAAAVEKVKTLTQEGSDNKGLKTLQGLIYKEGYEKGDLKAHIFDDVSEALEAWAKNHRVAVYSTGSVDSQKLLFSHTTQGDISAHIHKYFDQEVGLKTDSDSYKAIAKEVEVTPEEVVFITDDIKEATAAKNGGVTAVLIKREGNAELPEEAKDFTVISSFKDLALEKTAKRKNEEAAAEEAPPTKVPKTDTDEPEKPQQTEEKVEQTESMEVDAEKKPETENTAQPEPTPETEKSVEPEPEKTETKEETAEKKEEEKMEATEAEEAKVEVVEEEKQTEEVKEAKTDGETKEETKEEVKPAEEPPKEEAAAPAEESKVEEKPVENGEEKTEAKAEEKENKSVLANGVENGKEEVEKPEASEVQLEEQSDELKVKKLEESAESKTVSVEV